MPFLPKGRPAITMALVVSVSIGAVVYSHYAQVRDKAVMKAGVERDKERLRMGRAQKRREGKSEQQQQA
jgi:hypothetical protein